ncbi:GNAT family N-acetyltransferase [Chitinophaga rhizophila]|uniref:GNAT family N-acetyltransferase n=1 Tax=Chitinophaga rhizophila TaxID=2866212 RepID=A0ABS7GHJ2_9BACT|nr:GNAT family N-acetyltransferase [Chitinophaga rhizophila]MBW8687153.1 GNAT family N-acetyltransferase [Chitinophaga rhizophila]
MFRLETDRLMLIPLSQDLLQCWQEDRATMETALGLYVSAMEITPEYVAEIQDALNNFWLPQTAAHPVDYAWYTNWEIVLRARNISIGGIGFAGEADENGAVETGFMLDAACHGHGYAAEALKAMVTWAFTDPRVEVITARTYEHNHPAQRLLCRAGFIRGATTDELITYRLERR